MAVRDLYFLALLNRCKWKRLSNLNRRARARADSLQLRWWRERLGKIAQIRGRETAYPSPCRDVDALAVEDISVHGSRAKAFLEAVPIDRRVLQTAPC